MRRLGAFLMILGAIIGTAVGIGMLMGLQFPTLPWLVVVGLTKMTFFSGIGLIGAGAGLRRIAKRQEERLGSSGESQ